MSWIKLIYYPNDIKTHIVHDSTEEIVINDVHKKYGFRPTQRVEIEKLSIDPGGFICMTYEPLETKVKEGEMVSVRPEHIINSIHRWSKNRILDESNDEKIYKIYMSRTEVICITESIYNEVGYWMTINKAAGYIADAEITEALSKIPQLSIQPIYDGHEE